LRGGAFDASHRHLADGDVSILDVMVVWTKNAECRNSDLEKGCTRTLQTEANMRGLIDLAISETNTAYNLSGVSVELRLVHAYLDSDYTEATSDACVMTLKEINNKTDGKMDDIHAKRSNYGADLVALLIDDPQSCGFAWQGPIKNYMFSASAWDCATGYYSFGHEIGHNLVSSIDMSSKVLIRRLPLSCSFPTGW
jgi:hypothetical protein